MGTFATYLLYSLLLSSSVTLPRTAAIQSDSLIVYTNTNICSLIVLH